MLDVIRAWEPAEDLSAVLKMISEGTIHKGEEWEFTANVMITELDADFGRYYKITIPDTAGKAEEADLALLEEKLGKPLKECIVKREHHDRPHRFFLGSKSFDLVTLYAG
ncbi:hypothetical protein ACFYM5_18910 [Streptomyces sp. NPDC006706]|uniref:hypothetical protein n=1 Tax=Streptomyces sp. NPDC006706 TaxID=3364761 RepID=UPI00367C51CA